MLEWVAGVFPLGRVAIVFLKRQGQTVHQFCLQIALSLAGLLVSRLPATILLVVAIFDGYILQRMRGVIGLMLYLPLGVEVGYGLRESLTLRVGLVQCVGELLLDLLYFGEEHVDRGRNRCDGLVARPSEALPPVGNCPPQLHALKCVLKRRTWHGCVGGRGGRGEGFGEGADGV